MTLTRITSKTCKVCRAKFEPRQPMAKVCSPGCALTLAQSKRAKAEKVAQVKERKADRAQREKLKSRSMLLKECQVVVNKVVRLRDMLAGRGCITCGASPAQKFGGTMDAGHFRSVGSAPHLRFFTPQIALQCVTCNRYQGGRALDFRKALVIRKGSAWVDELEEMQGIAKFDVHYLRRLKVVFTKLGKRLEKRFKDQA